MPSRFSVAIFVCSSTNTVDVFNQVIPAFNRMWPDCPYPKFVGLNPPFSDDQEVNGFRAIISPQSGWRDELKAQIQKIESEFDHVILILDDFLVRSQVDSPALEALVKEAVQNQLPYLRLTPLRFSILAKGIDTLFLGLQIIRKIPSKTPYYSSLQIAVWNTKHLLSMLGFVGNIWQFEHQKIANKIHWAVVGKGPIDYRHMVEKGKWIPQAPKLFAKLELPFFVGSRGMWPTWVGIKLELDRIKFGIIGYSWVRFKSLFL